MPRRVRPGRPRWDPPFAGLSCVLRNETQPPSMQPAIEAVHSYVSMRTGRLADGESEDLTEIIQRLERLDEQAGQLMIINNRMWEREGPRITFDPASGKLAANVDGVESAIFIGSSDPEAPVQIASAAAFMGYKASAEYVDEEDASLRTQLEVQLESYYQSAHRVLKLFAQVRELAGIKCSPVSMVRNKLLEHPDRSTVYSFGVGSGGPTIRPFGAEDRQFLDSGLLPNTSAFVNSIVQGCAAVLARTT